MRRQQQQAKKTMEKRLHNIERSIDAVEKRIIIVERSLIDVETRINLVAQEIKITKSKTERQALRKKEQILMEKEQRLMEKEQRLMEKEQSLRDDKKSFGAEIESESAYQELTYKVEMTNCNQGPSSSFCTTYPEGFGFLPSYVRYDPTYADNERSLFNRLVPSQSEVDNAPRLRLWGEKMGLQSWGETIPGGVEQQFNEAYKLFPGLERNGQITLGSRGLSDGIASLSTYEDGHHKFGEFHLSSLENKGVESSPLSALSQSAVTATNFAMKLLKQGLPRAECIIPVIACTGLFMSFGAVVILEPSFPTFIPTSKHLDLSDSKERNIASAFLAKCSTHCERVFGLMSALDKNPPLSPPLLALSLERHFVKNITPSVYEAGLGLFAPNGHDPSDINAGIAHMTEALNLIFMSPAARGFAEYPLAIRTPDTVSMSFWQIVYRDLTQSGYRIGAPNRLHEEELFQTYLKALKYAIRCIHKAGVIHVDLYLSNVMWLVQEDGSIDIKIIDWDAAHCLDEGRFVPTIELALEKYLGRGNVMFGRRHDQLYLSALSLSRDQFHDEWTGLASNDKAAVNQSYRYLLSEILRCRSGEGGVPQNLRAAHHSRERKRKRN
jgi:hypothetical protein